MGSRLAAPVLDDHPLGHPPVPPGLTSSRLDEDYLGVMLGRQGLASHQVCADVLADRRVGAAAGFDCHDSASQETASLRQKRTVQHQARDTTSKLPGGNTLDPDTGLEPGIPYG